MTNRAKFDAYESRHWLSAEDTAATPAELRQRYWLIDWEVFIAAAVGPALLFIAGLAAAGLLLIFRAPLWQLMNTIPWWAWVGAALFVWAALWRRS